MRFLVRQWFLVSLLVVLCVGLVFYESLGPLAQATRVRNLIVMVTLFVVTLPVPGAMLARAIRYPWPALLASVISMALMPVAAMLLAQFLRGDLATGVIVTAATPGTVASAAVWTRRADGNEMVPILVTVLTSLTCFLITPFWLYLWTGQQTEIGSGISFGAMSIKLILFVVLPMVAGQWCRAIRQVSKWADEHRSWLSVISQCGILSIVLVGAVQCGLHLRGGSVGDSFMLAEFGGLSLLLVSLYVIVFWFGIGISPRPQHEPGRRYRCRVCREPENTDGGAAGGDLDGRWPDHPPDGDLPRPAADHWGGFCRQNPSL